MRKDNILNRWLHKGIAFNTMPCGRDPKVTHRLESFVCEHCEVERLQKQLEVADSAAKEWMARCTNLKKQLEAVQKESALDGKNRLKMYDDLRKEFDEYVNWVLETQKDKK